MVDIDEVIASAKLPEKTLPLCLRGDLQAEWEDLERQLKEAEDADDAPVLAGNAAARELAEQMEKLERSMREHEVVFRFRGLSSKKYSDLLVAHKAADDQQDEAVDGLNWDTYPTALIAACAIDPKMTLEQAERLNDAVTHRQWDDLFATALACNRNQVSIPFSLSASAIRAATAQNSKPPERTASLGRGSSAVSLAG
jgi:hypothetical protein